MKSGGASIQLDQKAMERVRLMFRNAPRNANKVFNRAMGRALASTRARAVRIVRDQYAVGASAVRSQIKTEKTLVRGEPTGSLIASGKPLSLEHFTVTPKVKHTNPRSPRVRYQLRKGQWISKPRLFKWQGRVFERTGSGREFFLHRGYSVPKMLGDNIEALGSYAGKEFTKRVYAEAGMIIDGKKK